MLFNGERVGTGTGPACDIAVDPIDGTSLAASGRPNALSMIAVAERGAMLDASSVFYMDKIVSGPEGAGVIEIDKPIGENIRALAAALGKPVAEMEVSVLDRPRHLELIQQIREAGAHTRLLSDGDVAGAISAAGLDGTSDLCVGVGGSPEGIVTACAVTALGGYMQARLHPRNEKETRRGLDAGLRMDAVFEASDLVKGDNTIFVATGVTDGIIVDGVRRRGNILRTESIILRGRSGTIRRIVADHRIEKWV